MGVVEPPMEAMMDLSDETPAPTLTLVEDDALSITVQPGDSGLSVVSFTGIGHTLGGGMQREEFRKTLRAVGVRNTVYFVIDRQRRWFNHGLCARVGDVLNASIAHLGGGQVATIGNSMGGSGAFLLAAALEGCDRALAFVPQSAVHSGLVPWEHRWQPYRREITCWDAADVVGHLRPDRVQYSVVIGGIMRDRQHARRFAEVLPRDRFLLIDGASHGVAQGLRDQGVLHGMVEAFLGGQDPLRCAAVQAA